ncbi:hypothetical protein DFQ29_003642 [Apophysomyces sp. BC1021]|nr:hypothetical protein DFQ29_003642 [Apophysomyces sp. BC1021]
MKKIIRLALNNGRFDDQYTFDLHGYLTLADFCSTMALFNQAVQRYSPPTISMYLVALSSLWMAEGVLAYVLWLFEQTMLEICGQLNAIQNVLDINFRFSKNVRWSDIKSVYSLMIDIKR